MIPLPQETAFHVPRSSATYAATWQTSAWSEFRVLHPANLGDGCAQASCQR
jgi:hypothetical protein